jgi:FKBP-type peptidyl-prolyl cis-trans isomerase
MYKYTRLSLTWATLIGSLVFIGCKHDGWKTAPTGLKYWILKDIEGENAKEGDVIQMHVKYTTSKDSVLFNSFTMPKPIVMEVPKSPFKGSFEEAVTMLSPGDSGQFLIAADSIFRKEFGAVRPSFIDSGSYLTFTVKLIKAEKKEVFIKKQELEKAERATKQKGIDEQIIAGYIAEKGLHPIKTEAGVYIQVEQEGKGNLPVAGDTISVHYTGRTLDGQVFDTSKKEDGGMGSPFDFVLGVTPIIQGWQDGISKLKKGSKAELIIPSQLAYGEQGTPKFGPNSVLTFNVEIVNVKTPKK